MATDMDADRDANIRSQARRRAESSGLRTNHTGLKCEACEGDIGPVEGAMGSFPIHMSCVKSRARAAQDGRCHCGSKRRPGPMQSVGGYRVDGERHGGRQWIPCKRCLGTIKQVR